jgi:4-alpha-glucanotransferase
MGDLPIYVAHDSADVWANPHCFHLDSDGNPTVVPGVPPDYFSATGQLWGNPIYRWDVLARDG